MIILKVLNRLFCLFCFYYKTLTKWHIIIPFKFPSFKSYVRVFTCIWFFVSKYESVGTFPISFLLLVRGSDKLVFAQREAVSSCADSHQPRPHRQLQLSFISVIWFVLPQVFIAEASTWTPRHAFSIFTCFKSRFLKSVFIFYLGWIPLLLTNHPVRICMVGFNVLW